MRLVTFYQISLRTRLLDPTNHQGEAPISQNQFHRAKCNLLRLDAYQELRPAASHEEIFDLFFRSSLFGISELTAIKLVDLLLGWLEE